MSQEFSFARQSVWGLSSKCHLRLSSSEVWLELRVQFQGSSVTCLQAGVNCWQGVPVPLLVSFSTSCLRVLMTWWLASSQCRSSQRVRQSSQCFTTQPQKSYTNYFHSILLVTWAAIIQCERGWPSMNIRRWGSFEAILEAGNYSPTPGPQWFTLLPHAKYTHPFPKAPEFSPHL